MLLSLCLIFFARTTDVCLGTIRILFLTRGKRFHAALLGFFEVTINITALSQVVGNLDSPWKLLVYGLGFSFGNIVGGYLEEKLAVGYTFVELVPKNHTPELITALRDENFGVTVLEGEGRTGPRHILTIILRRKDLPRLRAVIDQIEPDVFYTELDARLIKGGYFRGMDKK
ncbi:MAG TPA: DUF2179 domain-containing protein [Firmicutes bacterium]|uniref:UPF0316 protein G5B42_03405 n=1 Tax=Capillibacterium thermochitinicola TaxID=2699427 RepID=A0A8J6LLN9_9FIRM|nr:DUF2179 domain-containing protein [Capillibacterium thermochitinicola]MBA2132589.1 DUF2179 domain-containing protein [Capillibacterium thermochitinicola]HHW11852.1 DUF2179 domain-containing protein [Bacillota bacterium]